MFRIPVRAIVLAAALAANPLFAAAQDNADPMASLITETPAEGFALALTLARRGVTQTQPDTDVLQTLREAYARDPESLIAASHVVAVHFQTVAAANDYWRD